MLNRIALLVALGVLMSAEAEAARRGGCPNGQCGVRTYQSTYQPTAKVAVATEGQAAATAAVAEATPAATQQTEYVASQPTRRLFFRRWSR